MHRKFDVKLFFFQVITKHIQKMAKPGLKMIPYGMDDQAINPRTKYKWQTIAIPAIIRRVLKRKIGLVAVQVKTGHGKTRAQCEYAIQAAKEGKKVVIYLIDWDGTHRQFTEEMFRIQDSMDREDSGERYKYTYGEWKDRGEISIVKFPQNHRKIQKILQQHRDYDIHNFDETHKVMAYLGIRHFASHNCWNATRIKGYYDMMDVHHKSPFLDICTRSTMVLFSATFDQDIVQEISVYSGLFPIKLIVCKPGPGVIENIKVDWIESEAKDIIKNTVPVVIDNYTHTPGRMMVYLATNKNVRTLIRELKQRDIPETHIYSCTSADPGCLDKSKFKKINIFCEKATSGIDDPEIQVVIIGREMSDSNTNRGQHFKRIVSSLSEQMIGRIRVHGKVYFICNKKVTIKSLKDNIISRAEHIIEDSPKTYTPMYHMCLHRFPGGITDIQRLTPNEHLKQFCIPALLNTLLRDKPTTIKVCQDEKGRGAFIDLVKHCDYQYLVKNFHSITPRNAQHISEKYDSVCDYMMRAYTSYYESQEPILRKTKGGPNTVSRDKTYAEALQAQLDEIREQNRKLDEKLHQLMISSSESSDEEDGGNHHSVRKPADKRKIEADRDICSQETEQTVKDRCGSKCELCRSGWGVLQKARVHEGKDGGKYTPENILMLCPSCHTVFDSNETKGNHIVSFTTDSDSRSVQFHLLMNTDDTEHVKKVMRWNKYIPTIIQGTPDIYHNFCKREQLDKMRL